MQGGNDQRVLPDTAQRLYIAAGAPKYLWIEPAASHIAIIEENPAAYERHIIGFFDSALLGKTPVK